MALPTTPHQNYLRQTYIRPYCKGFLRQHCPLPRPYLIVCFWWRVVRRAVMFSCFTITIRLRQSLRRFPGVRFASGECFFVVAARRCSVLFFQKCLDSCQGLNCLHGQSTYRCRKYTDVNPGCDLTCKHKVILGIRETILEHLPI